MRRRPRRSFALVIAIIFMSGCARQTAVIIPDLAYTLFSSPGSKESLGSGVPEWQAALKEEKISSRLFLIRPEEHDWQERLAAEKTDFLLWTPLWSREAFNYHSSHPDMPGILLSPGGDERPIAGGGMPALLYPDRQKGWEALAEILQNGAYRHVAGVFSSTTGDRDEELRVLLERTEMSHLAVKGKNEIERGKEFLREQTSLGADFVIIAASGANGELFDVVKNLSIPVFLEAPFPGWNARDNIKGVFIIPWEEGIRKLAGMPRREWPASLGVEAELLWR